MDKPIEKKKWQPKRIFKYSVLGIFIILIAYFLLQVSGASTLNVEADKIIISTVETGKFQEFISVTGAVMPVNTIYLDAVEGGMVEKIYVEPGAKLNEGDKILKLSNTNLLLDIMYREAELVQQSNNLRSSRLSFEQSRLSLMSQIVELGYQLKNSELSFKRKKELYDKKFVSEEEFELAKNQYQYLKQKFDLTVESQKTDSIFRLQQIIQLEQSLDRMKSNMEVVRLKLDNLTIKAPISGLLSSLNAEVGEHKSPGQRLGQIDDMLQMKIRAEIDEHFISRVKKGQIAKVELDGREYALKISKVYPEVQNGQFLVEMEFSGSEPPKITRGQTMNIKLELSDVYDAVLLDRGGFFRKTGGRWVYVLDKSGNIGIKRNIKLGRMNPDYFEVVDGLKPGERVITSSYDSFGDAEEVKLK